MNNRTLIYVIAALMLFTTASPAQAIVPAVAWVIWGVAAGVAGSAVITGQETEEQHTAGTGEQEQKSEIQSYALEHQPTSGG